VRYKIVEHYYFIGIDKTIRAEKILRFHLEEKRHQHGMDGMEKSKVKPCKGTNRYTSSPNQYNRPESYGILRIVCL